MKTTTQTLKRKTAFVFKGKGNTAEGFGNSQPPTTTTIVTLPSVACTGKM